MPHFLDDPDRNRPGGYNSFEPVRTGYGPYSGLARPEMAGEEPGGFIEYWRLLSRHKGRIALITGLALAAALLVTLPQKPVYQARTTVEIQGFNDEFMKMKELDPTAPVANDTAESFVQTQIKILQSRALLERVVDKLKMQPPAANEQSWRAGLRRMLGIAEPPPASNRERFLYEVGQKLNVRAAGQTRIVEVLYEDEDPKLAAEFANTLASEFIEQSQELRWKSAQRTGQWLTAQLDDMKNKLQQSETKAQDYASANGLIMMGNGTDNVAEAKLRQIQDDLSKAQAERVSKQSMFELASSASVESLPEMIDDATLRDYRTKLTELQRQRADLVATLTPAHYRVQKVDAQIAELESALKRERTNMLGRIQNDYQSAQRRETLLTQAYSRQARSVTDLSNRAITYNIMKREADSNRQLYESLLARVKEAGVAAAMRASNIMIVDPAKPPFLPYKPNILVNSAIGLFGGLFLAIAFVLVRERADRSIQAPGDSASYLNIPELGVIPTERIPIAAAAGPLTLLKSGNGNGNGPTGELARWNHKPSLMAESFRATLTSLMFSSNNGDRPRAIVITSAAPGEGKTTVASNLGMAMAEINRRVLLIDGDLRQPRLHKVFGMESSPGLSDLLAAREPIDSYRLGEIATETSVPGVWLLPAGSATQNIANLLYSARMLELLGRVRRDFDMVLVDAPPMLQLADARVLARLADGVVMVIRAGRTTRETAMAALHRLGEDGSRVLGTILNSWDLKRASDYGYGYYAKTANH